MMMLRDYGVIPVIPFGEANNHNWLVKGIISSPLAHLVA